MNREPTRRPVRRRGRHLAVAALLGAVLAIPSPAAAQTCFRGRPLPDCRSFWLTEVGFSLGSRRDSSSAGGESTGHLMTWELGYMRNLGEHYAGGGTAFIEGDGLRMARLRAGLKGRYRVWLEEGRSVDFAPGVILIAEEPSTPGSPEGSLTAGYDLGGVLAVGYNIGDVVSFTAQVEAIQYPSKTVQMAGYVGVRLGSYPGAVAAFLAIIAVAISIPAAATAFLAGVPSDRRTIGPSDRSTETESHHRPASVSGAIVRWYYGTTVYTAFWKILYRL